MYGKYAYHLLFHRGGTFVGKHISCRQVVMHSHCVKYWTLYLATYILQK